RVSAASGVPVQEVVGLMLEARGLSKSFGHVEVLRDVSMVVPQGRTHVILGPSGSGKSTLLRCLALLETIDEGHIALDGVEIAAPAGRHRRRPSERALARHRSEIGMVFQRFTLFPNMTARENVMLGLVEVRRMPRHEASEVASSFLARVGLAPD